MLVSLTVGKVDAGVAVLLTEDKRLIEFPSILLPPDIHSGSIVDVNVSRNLASEASTSKRFTALQSQILSTFGSATPSTPNLRCRNATQTSVVLEWDPISLATADLRHLTLYRNGSKAGNIPKPFENTSTKISGLAVDSEYKFSLVLRTSAGMYSSETLRVRTHKMTDLSGITVTPGVMPAPIRASLDQTLAGMGARLSETVRIDTTHFVCTEGRGTAWEKAVDMNVPVVVPDWVKGCEREGRIVGVRGYYLNADPRLRQVGPGAGLQRQESMSSVQSPQMRGEEPQQTVQTSQLATPRTEVTPPTPERRREDEAEDEEGRSESEHARGRSERHSAEERSASGRPSAEEDDEEHEQRSEGIQGMQDEDEDDKGMRALPIRQTSTSDDERSHDDRASDKSAESEAGDEPRHATGMAQSPRSSGETRSTTDVAGKAVRPATRHAAEEDDDDTGDITAAGEGGFDEVKL